MPCASLISTVSASMPRTARPDHDERRLGGRGGDVAGRHARADQDDPADAVLEQRGQRGPLAPGLPASGGEQQLVAELGGELLDTAGDLGEERVAQVVEDHPDGLGPAAGQAARHRVRAVAEPRGGVEHAPAALLADVGALAHDQRDERARDTGLARDVLHRGGAAGERPGAPRTGGTRRASCGGRYLERDNIAIGLERSNPPGGSLGVVEPGGFRGWPIRRPLDFARRHGI